MSHVATVKVKIQDLDALRAVLPELGLEWREGQKTYKWYGRSVGDTPLPAGMTAEDLGKCEHAIAVKGASGSTYEVGVVRVAGGYTLAFDEWAGGHGLIAKTGERCMNVIRNYVREVATRTLRRTGFSQAGQSTLADGTVQMVFRR